MSIPSISLNRMNSLFDSIDAELSLYENLEEAHMLLELTKWKSNITKQFGRNSDTLNDDIKMNSCTDSVTVVSITVPNVLSILTDGDDGNVFFGSNKGDGDGNHGNNDED
jgi:hypothetical protein